MTPSKASVAKDAPASTPAPPPRGVAPPDFVEALFGRVPPEDIRNYAGTTLADLAATAYEHLRAPRREGSPDLRLVDVEIERGERRREVTIIEVVNDNMPFLLDSTLAEILDQGYEPKLVAHPILALERNAAGALSRFYGEATGHDPGQAKRESFIHIHLDRIDDEAARLRLTEGLQKVYGDVAVAVRDWAAMRDAIVSAIREYAAQPPPLPRDDVREAIAFLEWLADNNFTFLGVREYRFPEEDTAADPIQESGLGLLRDPTVSVLRRGRELVVMTPELRAFLSRPQALIVTKANVKSRVHRRVHLDYIGIKLFLPNGRLRGELRLVGLFTSDAYTSTPGSVPYLRLKVAKVIARAGFDPSSHSGRALLNVLDTYPRDELFQIDEDTLYRFAVEIMNLSERPRIRALARIDHSIASCPSSSSSPRTATIPPSAAASASSWRPFTTAAFRPLTRPIRKGSLARTHYIIGRDEGATPVIERDVLEDGIAAIARTWSDRLGEALADGVGGRRARALAARYGNAFNAAYREAFDAEHAISDIETLESLSDARPRAVDLYRREGDPQTRINLKIFSPGASLLLSERVPLLENLGFRVVNERTYHVTPAGADRSARVWLHDMALERAARRPPRHRRHRGLGRGGAAGPVPRPRRIGPVQHARPRSRARLARRRHDPGDGPLPASGRDGVHARLPRGRPRAPRRHRGQDRGVVLRALRSAPGRGVP